MRETETVSNIVLRQTDDGEFWLVFYSPQGSTSIGLSRGYKGSTARTILEAWAEKQFTQSEDSN